MSNLFSKLNNANEDVWLHFGSISELMYDTDKTIYSYENVLRHNPYNIKALTQIASICRIREQYSKAIEYFQRILNIESSNGEIWGAVGHCYLMMDDLQKAYSAYQQALYHLTNPKDPHLWYGIGILYDRYGSFEHAEEAFTAVLKMDPKFEKSNEIYFRLGIIYKQQSKYEDALNCFHYILQKPPRPLTQADVWFQIGHVHELQKDFNAAKDAYERVLKESPNHAKSLQQLGWLYHTNSSIGNQDTAITFLLRSIESDPSDGQTWYLLGRCYMAQRQYRKAYDAYQQAVYRDARNPTFWCSIGVLYYQINQYRDALDAYSRAIRLNPYLSEVWYDLGTLYESCNQITDSLDAYQRASELDPGNKHIQQRLSILRESQASQGKNAPVSTGSNVLVGAVSSASKMGELSLGPSLDNPTGGPSFVPENTHLVNTSLPMTMEPRTHPNGISAISRGIGTCGTMSVTTEMDLIGMSGSINGTSSKNIIDQFPVTDHVLATSSSSSSSSSSTTSSSSTSLSLPLKMQEPSILPDSDHSVNVPDLVDVFDGKKMLLSTTSSTSSQVAKDINDTIDPPSIEHGNLYIKLYSR